MERTAPDRYELKPSVRRCLRLAAVILRRSVIVVVLLPVLFLALNLVAIPVIDILKHDRELGQYEQDFSQLRHPMYSTLVSSESEVGLLVANGNHCDYFVGELREAPATRNEIELFYRGRTIGYDVPIHVMFIENGRFAHDAFGHLPYDLDEVTDWQVPRESSGGTMFIAYVLDSGFRPGLDPRCH